MILNEVKTEVSFLFTSMSVYYTLSSLLNSTSNASRIDFNWINSRYKFRVQFLDNEVAFGSFCWLLFNFIKIDKENLHSAMEIGSPSSSCTQGAKSVMNYETDDAQNDDNQFSKNGADSEDVLAVSMIKLYSAQDAFQIELQKLKDVGKTDHESAMLKAIEYLKVQIEVMVEEKKVLSEQMLLMKKLEDAEVKAIGLKMQAEKLKVTCEDILEKEQVWEVRNMQFQ
ncbi:hypothetical protein L1987_79794 [Smallanthus sonchifolius]|uniref:Uncharacterized protein n=1 Tax=Smallanthus sonchifolius TaxID=185202 RepID=A0ACB8YK63_9ASTR|nr:hypothetical protein L1987_79794 [Smallanthus sonchifolius]